MKLFGKEISKSQVKAVGTLAAVVGVGAALVYGGSYIVKGGSDLLSDPKRAVMVSINESDSLSLEDRSYLFDYNASLIPVENGLVVCNSKIYERASPEQQLDILLAQIVDQFHITVRAGFD